MPVMEINPRFVRRAYPVAGGEGGFGVLDRGAQRWMVVEKCRLRLRHCAHTVRVDGLERIMFVG